MADEIRTDPEPRKEKNGIDWRLLALVAVIVALLLSLWVGVSQLISLANALTADDPKLKMSDFAQGMVLTAVTGAIAALLASLTLLVKSLADSTQHSGRNQRGPSEGDR